MTENPQDQPTSPQQPYAAQAPVSPSDARMWSMLAHLGGIVFSFVPSLVIYLVYKDRDRFIRRHAAQALSFQIIATIALIVSGALKFVFIGYLTGFATGVCVLVFSIIAAIAANKGEEYTYPQVPKIVT